MNGGGQKDATMTTNKTVELDGVVAGKLRNLIEFIRQKLI